MRGLVPLTCGSTGKVILVRSPTNRVTSKRSGLGSAGCCAARLCENTRRSVGMKSNTRLFFITLLSDRRDDGLGKHAIALHLLNDQGDEFVNRFVNVFGIERIGDSGPHQNAIRA